MNNFTFRNPTKLVFGKDSILELPKLFPQMPRSSSPSAEVVSSVMVSTEAVISQLSGFQTVEFWGIEPTPR